MVQPDVTGGQGDKLCQVFVLSAGQLEFRPTRGGKRLRWICPNVSDSFHIQGKAFRGGLYCFTRTLKSNSSITAD